MREAAIQGAADDRGERPPIGFLTKVAYGSGAIANAVKTRTISVFLLLFYNQVVGLPPAITSAVIMVTLVFDALVDPMVGQLSDNHRSRWGRRHPFMYAAALPTALLYFLIWNPPVDWAQPLVIAWLAACLVAIRLFDTFFELPAMALLPELTDDYDQRTQIVAIRQFFSVAFGLGMITLAYQVFLREHPDGSGGVAARDGYFGLSAAGAALIFTFILVSAAGTHRQIPWLRKAPVRTPGVKAMVREIMGVLNNRSFLAVAIAGLFSAVVVGMKGSLDIYWWLYLFGLEQSQIALIAGIGMTGSVCGAFLAPWLVGRLGKKRAAVSLFVCAAVFTTGPMVLWLAGTLPAAGSTGIFVFLAADQFLNSISWSMMNISTVALMADVVEDVEVKTGRRSEGLLFSAEQLFKKSISGMGVLSAGLILAVAAFPADAAKVGVDHEVLARMATAYVAVAGALFIAAIFSLRFFAIDKAKHVENLATLRGD